MSRIVKKPILFEKDTIVLLEDNFLKISKNNKEAYINIPSFIDLKIDDNSIQLREISKNPISGTKRQEIFNAIEGLEKGFFKTLKLYGVGYNLYEKDNFIYFNLGFSHIVKYEKKTFLEYRIINKDTFSVSSINKHLLGLEISKIKNLRKRNAYDCYGIYDIQENRIKKDKRKK